MLALFLTSFAAAQPTDAPPTQVGSTVVYGNVMGGLGFALLNVGDFAVGVEHVFGGRHGLLAEATLIHVHGDPTHATTYGVQAGYRFHLAPVDAPFVGLLVGYEVGGAKVDIAEHGGPYWSFGLSHVSVVPHVGYRWGIGRNAAVTARLGGGYGAWTVTARDDAPAEAEALLADRLQFSPIKVDMELSLGVRF